MTQTHLSDTAGPFDTPMAEASARLMLRALAHRFGADGFFVHVRPESQWQLCIDETGDDETLAALLCSSPLAEVPFDIGNLDNNAQTLTVAHCFCDDTAGTTARCGLFWRDSATIDAQTIAPELKPLAQLIHVALQARAIGIEHHALQSALDAVPHLVWVMGEDRRYLFQNRADRESFQDMSGRRLADTHLPAKTIKEWGALHSRAFSGEYITLLDEKQVGDKTIYAENLISPIKGQNGAISAIVGLSIDRTAQQRAEQARQGAMDDLEKTRTLLEDIAELSGVGGWELDVQTQHIQWTQQTRRIHEVDDNYEPDLDTAVKFYPPESFEQIKSCMDRAIATGGQWDEDFPFTTALNNEIIVRVVGRAVVEDGQVVRLQGAIQDVTQLRRSQRQLQEALETADNARALLEDIVEAVPDGIVAFDANERLILHNRAFLSFYESFGHDALAGKTFEELMRSGLQQNQFSANSNRQIDQAEWLRDRLERFRNPGASWVMQLHDGRWLQVRDRKTANGNTVGIRSDVSAIKRNEQTLKYLAEHDVLTGLANREAVHGRLEALTANTSSDANATSAMLVIIDLDNFKDINDTLGHDVGDEVLRVVASRLLDVAHNADVTCRLGGDEFGVVFSGLKDERDAQDQLVKLARHLKAPLTVQSNKIHTTYSIGASLFPRDGETPSQLFKNADIALYEAKRSGRDRWHLFEPKLRNRLERRQLIVDRLASGRPGDKRDIALQPKFDAKSGQHYGFETLLRWQLDGKPVSPAEFIAVAEESGKIVEWGRFALERTLAVYRQACRDGLTFGHAAVNVAAAQLREPGFVDDVTALLDQYQMEATTLEFEITETVLLDRQSDAIANTLNDLKSLGVDIALDDFGTGYASLSHLYQFPIDVLKIDREFVGRMLVDREAVSIVRAIIGLGQDLGLKVVAEGVEQKRQIEMLRAMNCDLLQGFGLGVPMEPDRALAYMAETASQRKTA